MAISWHVSDIKIVWQKKGWAAEEKKLSVVSAERDEDKRVGRRLLDTQAIYKEGASLHNSNGGTYSCGILLPILIQNNE